MATDAVNLGQGGPANPVNQQDQINGGKDGRWEVIKTGVRSMPESNKFWITLAVIGGGVGLASLAIVSVALGLNVHHVPTALNAISNTAATSMIAAGGAFALMGLAALGVLGKRYHDEKQRLKKERAEEAAKIATQKRIEEEHRVAKRGAYEQLPNYLKEKALELPSKHFGIVKQKVGLFEQDKYTFIWSTINGYKIEENILEENLGTRTYYYTTELGLTKC